MLDEPVLALARAANFAALTTLLPGGQPQTHVMWVDADDDGSHLIVNTEVHRQKFKNIERDPRVTLAIWKAGNPYQYAEIRGHVVETIRGPQALESIHALSRKYTGNDFAAPVTSERVIVKIAPDRQLAR
jgi:PPOX class probable F420-dependent enzyme